MLAGGGRGEHYWGRLLREVWWFLNWLLPPQSHPALQFKWRFQKSIIDALSLRCSSPEELMKQELPGTASFSGAPLAWLWAGLPVAEGQTSAGTVRGVCRDRVQTRWPYCSCCALQQHPFTQSAVLKGWCTLNCSAALGKGRGFLSIRFGGWCIWLTPMVC